MKKLLVILSIILMLLSMPTVLANETVSDVTLQTALSQTSVPQFDEFDFFLNVTNGNSSDIASNFTINIVFPYDNITLTTVTPTLQTTQRIIDAIDGNVTWDFQNISASSVNEYSLELDTAQSGNHIISYSVANISGSILDAGTIQVTIIDTVNPLVTINQPLNQTNNNIDFEIEVSEVSSAIYTLDNGATNNTMLTSDNLTFVADGSTLADGYYEVIYYVTDLTGNTNFTESVGFTVDNTNPLVTINEPQNTTYTTDSIPFDITLNELGSQASFDLEGTDYTMNTGDSLTYTYTNNSVPDGFYTVTYTAQDIATNTNDTQTISFSVDTTPPSITFNEPNNGEYFNQTTFDVEITLNQFGSANVSIDGGSNTFAMDTTDNLTFNYTFNSVTDGIYTIDITAADVFGNANTDSQIITVDTIEPEVSLTTPSSNELTNNPSVLFSVSLNENGSALLSIDNNATFVTMNTVNNQDFTYTNASVPSGDYNITVVVNDTAGNSNVTFSTFSVDTILPSITFNEPNNNTFVNVTSFFIETIVSEPTSTVVSLDNGATNNTMFTDDNVTFNYTFSSITDGTYTITVYATDNATNVNNSQQTITIDTTNPLITINDPNNTTITSSMITLNITGNEDLDAARYSLDNGATNSTMSTGDDQTFSATTTLADGYYIAQYYTNDTAGNSNNTESITFTIDTTGPQVTINSPENRTYNSQTQTFNITFNEPGFANLSLDSGATNLTMETVDNLTFNYTLTGLTEGSHTVNFYTVDRFGNRNDTVSLTFGIDLTLPTITITNPAQSEIVTVDSVTVQASSNEIADTMWYTLDGGVNNISMSTGNNVDFTHTNTSISDNLYTLVVYANDTAGNVNSSNLTFRIDTLPPQVTVFQPVDLEYYNNGLFSIDIGETGQAWLSIDGGPIIFMNTTDGQAFTYQDNSLADGMHTVQFYANDSNNNINDSMFSTFWIDTDTPNMTITSPVPQFYNETNISLFGTLNESGEILFSYNGGATNFSMNTLDGFSFSYIADYVLPDGDYTVTFYGLDNASNTVILDINISRDSFGPEFSITNPSAGQYGQDSVTLTAEFTEDLKSVYYTVNGGLNVNMNPQTATTYVSTINGLNDNTAYTFQVFATDTQGRTTNRTRNINTNFRPDVTVRTPVQGESINNDEVIIDIESSELVNATYDLNSSGVLSCFNVSVSGSCTLMNMTNGTYTLDVAVVDMTGNVNTTQVNFTIAIIPDAPDPTPTPTSSGGGGGGGGSSRRVIVPEEINDTVEENTTVINETNITEEAIEVITEITFEVVEDELNDIVFIFDNGETLEAVAVVKDTLVLGEEIITVEVEVSNAQSDVQTIFIASTQPTLVDLDGDGTYDIEFTLEGDVDDLEVIAKYASIPVEVEEGSQEENTPVQAAGSVRNFITTQVTGFNAGNTGDIITGVLFVAGGILIIGVVSQVVIRVRKPKK